MDGWKKKKKRKYCLGKKVTGDCEIASIKNAPRETLLDIFLNGETTNANNSCRVTPALFRPGARNKVASGDEIVTFLIGPMSRQLSGNSKP